MIKFISRNTKKSLSVYSCALGILFSLLVPAYGISFNGLCSYFISVNYAVQTPDGGYLLSGFKSDKADIKKIGKNLYLQWEKIFNKGEKSDAYFVAPANDGNFIVIGYTEPVKGKERDIWLFKINKHGQLKWHKTIRINYWNEVYSIFKTKDKGFILSGVVETKQGNDDGLIIKLDRYGKIQWKKEYGDKNKSELIYSVVQTMDGGYAFVGLKKVNLNKKDSIRIWIGKLNEKGNFQWEKVLKSSRDNGASFAIAPSLSGEIIVAGSGDHRYWFMELGKSGKLEWKRTFKEDAVPYFLIQTQDGGYAAAISYSYDTDKEGKLIKFNKKGIILWTAPFGKSPSDIPTSLEQLRDGSLILTGFTHDDTCYTTNSWVMKFNSKGKLLWVKYVDGKFLEELASVVQSGKEDFIALGFTTSTGNNKGDIVLIKLTEAGKLTNMKILKGPDEEYPQSIIEIPDGNLVLSAYVSKPESMNGNSEIIILNKRWKVLNKINVTKKYHIKINHLLPDSKEGFYVIGKSTILRFRNTGEMEWKRDFRGIAKILYVIAKKYTGTLFVFMEVKCHNRKNEYKIFNLILNKDGRIIKRSPIIPKKIKGKDIEKLAKTKNNGIIVYTTYLINDISSATTVTKYNKYEDQQWTRSFMMEGDILLSTKDNGYALIGICPEMDDEDICIIKIDNNGKVKWKKTYGGSDLNSIEYATQTKDGGFVIISTIESTKDLGNPSGLMQKIDSKGNLQWDYMYWNEW